MCGQCGMPDLYRDHGRPVWRTGPQPRACEDMLVSRCPKYVFDGLKEVKKSARVLNRIRILSAVMELQVSVTDDPVFCAKYLEIKGSSIVPYCIVA